MKHVSFLVVLLVLCALSGCHFFEDDDEDTILKTEFWTGMADGTPQTTYDPFETIHFHLTITNLSDTSQVWRQANSTGDDADFILYRDGEFYGKTWDDSYLAIPREGEIPPGETHHIDIFWPANSIARGEYRVVSHLLIEFVTTDTPVDMEREFTVER